MNSSARVKWACRRGLLELDLMLLPFVEAQYDSLTAEEKSCFQHVLSETDPTLLAYFMGEQTPPTEAEKQLIEKIRTFRKQKSATTHT